ncbi:MAG: T9SS type A sorting domain-containing protein [Candidatus Delongbacteria bacterium]|nr:T9SS type A sorting domain-containing protein [Candidatus Delongbacteria bacterium]
MYYKNGFTIILLLGSLLIGSTVTTSAAPAVQTFTDPVSGLYQESGATRNQECRAPATSFNSREERLETLWEFEDPSAIVSYTRVSSVSGGSFVGWWLNNERVSYHTDSAIPVWENPILNCDWDVIVDMVPDGSLLAAVDGPVVQIYTPDSSLPAYELNIPTQPNGMELSPDGTLIYTAESNTQDDSSTVSCRDIVSGDLVWEQRFLGGSQKLVLSGDGNTLLFTQYGGPASAIWGMHAADGEVFFQAANSTQNPPAISHDGGVMARGDYSGYIYAYQFDSEAGSYEEIWNFHVGGGGTSVWVGGVTVSADGGTIAAGTMVFLTEGYDGEIYLFNTPSPQPLWVYEHVGDYVVALDLSADGAILAAASWGPLDHTTADFLLFRRDSNLPIYTITTPGSMMALDLAADGSRCIVGGKAVHARQMGSGGLLYCVESDPGGGEIAGNVHLEGMENHSGARVEVPDLEGYLALSDSAGDYLIEFVPAGSWVVQASCIGYNTVLEPVVVADGETSTQDFALFPNSSPPSGLTASQGAGLGIVLNWIEPPTDDYIGFNVYRKSLVQEPYPDIPVATLEASELTWTDLEAMPTRNYYYVVTSILPGDLQSPFSNEAVGWTSSGFITQEVPAWTGTTPTIDGELSAGEWDDAYRLECSDFLGTYDNSWTPVGSVQGWFKVNAEFTELYVAFINQNDTVLEDHDEIGLYIDDNNDRIFPPQGLRDDSEGNYWAAYYASGAVIKYRPLYAGGGAGTVMFLDDPQIAVSDATGYLVYEFVLPIGTLDWEINPDPNGQSGFLNFTLDDPDEFDGWWPAAAMDPFDPSHYGTLSLGAEPQLPQPPENLTGESVADGVLLAWEMPVMNDFDHFNVWISPDGNSYELVEATVGVQYFCQLDQEGNWWFRITTINQQGDESDPSQPLQVEYEAVTAPEVLPWTTELRPNYPNPFNPSTRIEFTLAHQQGITLTVYNILGQRVAVLAEGNFGAGLHQITFDAGGFTSGVYFYRLTAGDQPFTRKMILVR